MNFKTLAIHAGHNPREHQGAVMTPIYQTSTFAFRGVGEPGPFDYSRSGNPTRKALESCLAQLGGRHGGIRLCHGNGRGSHRAHDVSRPVIPLSCTTTFTAAPIACSSRFLPASRFARITLTCATPPNLTPRSPPVPKAVWLESPTNPLMNLVDIRAVSDLAHQHGARVICDNTFLSPYFQRPLDLGADIVTHSTTKYINGHSDVVGGAVVVKDPGSAEKIGFLQNAMGTCAGPQDCFLVLRGVKTLALRMEEHNRNALAIAQWLEKHPKVAAVLHPGLESHPQHELALRQTTGSGGTFSFRLRGGEAAVNHLLANCRVFTLAESLGGVESLIEHPTTMTHASMPREVQLKMGITPDLVRVSVGLEDVSDLIADLESALAGA